MSRRLSRLLGSVPHQRIVKPRLHSHTSATTTKQADSAIATSQLVDVEDVRRHARLAEDWWNPNGPMRALHTMNRIR